MGKLVLTSACLIAAATLAGPAMAKDAECDAKYYGHLVGKDIGETHSITGSDYRLVPMGSAATASKPDRMTIRYDRASNRIVEISCG